MKRKHISEMEELEAKFNTRMERLQEEYNRELSDTTEQLKAKHKRELGNQKSS